MNFKKGEVLFFNKPLGWTSFKVVGHARYHICRRIGVKKLKVGHAGTLDPLATGVMIVCTGKATKRIEEFQYHTKEYIATLRLGATTPSYDLEHEIDATYPTEHITREMVEEVLTHFIGTIEQVPPAFSACMVDGKRAYELARKGEEVELKAKQLVIDVMELLHTTRIRIIGTDDSDSCGMQQGNVYPCVGTRYWRSTPQRSASDGIDSYTCGRCPSGRLSGP